MSEPWIAPDLAAVLATLADEAILGLTLFGEARSEPVEGIVAVGSVIRNRKQDQRHRWGSSFRDVCLQSGQFSCWNPVGGPNNYARLKGMTEAIARKAPEMHHPAMEQCAWVALGIAKNALLDNTKAANHYHSVRMTKRPHWARPHVPVKQVSGHVFYAIG